MPDAVPGKCVICSQADTPSRYATWRHYPRQEPDAVVPPVRICAGGGPRGPSLPQSSVYYASDIRFESAEDVFRPGVRESSGLACIRSPSPANRNVQETRCPPENPGGSRSVSRPGSGTRRLRLWAGMVPGALQPRERAVVTGQDVASACAVIRFQQSRAASRESSSAGR
jgi:hypothetical protein